MAGWAYIDDAFVPAEEAKMSIFDLGFMRGDAVYDTTSVWKGRFFRLDDHIARFFRSCAGMRLVCPHEPAALKRILAECVARTDVEDAYVQMILTRGRFANMQRRVLAECTNRFICYAVPYIWIITPEKQEVGIDLAVVQNRRTPTEAIDPTVKNFNWMDLERGLLESQARGADHAVLLTPAGHVSEGPGFNVFWIKNRKLYTPKGNVLEGITRRTVIELAQQMGIPVEMGDYPPERLREADEAFLSSTAGGIMPVTRVDGRPLGNGAPGLMTSDLKGTYWRKREEGWLGTPVATLLPERAVA